MIRTSVHRQLGNAIRTAVIPKRYAHAPVTLNWEDPLDSASLFTAEEVAIQETANSYCQERMLPRVLGMDSLGLFMLYKRISTNPIDWRCISERAI